MTPDVLSILKTGAALADDALERLLPAPTIEPHSIHRAMRHSTFAGGKRLRPILCMEAARCVAHELPPAAPNLGAAIEMVHTYSLIHDDLPALDNDDLRRGKPTCHIAFGEAIAILAGDALQTLAFQTIAQLDAGAATIVEILREFSFAIGTGVGAPTSLPPGMIGGQVMDIESEGRKPTAELVERIHRSKTGALITTSIVCGGLLGLDLAASPTTQHQGSPAPLLTSSPASAPSAKRPALPSRSSTTSSTSRKPPSSSARPPARTPPPTKPHGPQSSVSTALATTPTSSSRTPSPHSNPSAPRPIL